MRITVISLILLIFLIAFLARVSSVDVLFNSPEQVKIGEIFSVKIEANVTTTYDVKIFVKDSNEETISEIENDGWKNPYYYIKSSFPDKKEYEIRVVKGIGTNDICVRLRQSGKNTYNETCKEIEVEKSSNEESTTSTPNNDVANNEEKENVTNADSNNEKAVDNEDTTNKVDNRSSQNTNSLASNYVNSSEANKNNESTVEKLMLNPSVIKEPEVKNVETGKAKVRTLMIFAFVIFCIAIVLLIFYKKI